LYDAVVRLALPGDLVFFITELPDARSFPWPARLYRRWLGVAPRDATLWHTAVYVGAAKEGRGRQVRPRIVHARRGGVVEEHLPPSFFTSAPAAGPGGGPRARLEVLQHGGLGAEQRRGIVAYCRAQLGKAFADAGWRGDLPTCALGLPGPRHDPAALSC